jgi:hypothetical protein
LDKIPMATDPKRKFIAQERAPGRMFDMYLSDSHIEMFADGIGRVAVGAQVTKVDFFRTADVRTEKLGGVEHPLEEREVILRLTIPTQAFVEACGTMIELAVANSAVLEAANLQLKTVIERAVERASSKP